MFCVFNVLFDLHVYIIYLFIYFVFFNAVSMEELGIFMTVCKIST